MCLCKSVSTSRQKGKRAEPPKVRTGQKQEVSAFSCHLLLDLCRFLRKAVYQNAGHYGEVENVVTSCFVCQTGSASIFLLVIDWFVRLTFTIVFIIPRNPFPEKTAQINQLRTGKCWHFLFGEQNRKWRHLGLHHSVPHAENPPYEKMAQNN